MTNKQYAIYKARGTKIYNIKIVKSNFVVKEVPVEKFDESWTARNWLNKSVIYDCSDHTKHIYATEDRIEECKKKLYKHIKKRARR